MAHPSEGLPGAWPAALSPAIIAHQRTLAAPRLAPDGRRLAYVAEYDARADLHVLPEGGWPAQITADQAVAGGNYAWSPDGAQIVFTAAGDGQLWLCPAAGGPPRRLTHGDVARPEGAPRSCPRQGYVPERHYVHSLHPALWHRGSRAVGVARRSRGVRLSAPARHHCPGR